MKFKYFLRGLGFGIVFSAMICLTAYQGNSAQRMTDEEVIRRAEELGMVEPEDKVGELLGIDKQGKENKDEKKDETSQSDTETVKQEENPEEVSEETKENKDAASEKISETDKNAKTENRTSEQEEKKSEASTEKKEDTTEKQSDKTVKLTIERGASSFPVCQKLQELGLIENASDFDTYLVENGYASRIRVGEHTLKKGMSYQDIAEAISDPL